MTVNELVNEALIAWAKVARLDPERNTFGGWHAREEIDALNQSREWDPSGLTTFMMLRGLLDQYLTDEVHFSAKDLIENPEKVIERMRPIKALREVLEQPEVVEIIEQFQKRILDAAAHYGVKPEGVKPCASCSKTSTRPASSGATRSGASRRWRRTSSPRARATRRRSRSTGRCSSSGTSTRSCARCRRRTSRASRCA
jgi:hypothetical protein